MEYVKLGNTDIEVSRLCVGCMSFGKAGTMHDWTLNETESEEMIRHALSLGINFFDTANVYSEGTSEEYLGRAIKKNIAREKVVIASKVYFNEGRLSREAILREIDGTLQRLGTDYLDFYIIHRFDYHTPIEETMEALHDLVKAGKVCVDGEGWYQEEGKAARSLKPGDVVIIPAEVKHWHGAKKDCWFSHLAIECPGEETSNEWLEMVTDEEYGCLEEEK